MSEKDIKKNIVDEKKATENYSKQSKKPNKPSIRKRLFRISKDESEHLDINRDILTEEAKLRRLYKEARRGV